MKSRLSVSLLYNCQPVRIGLWCKNEREIDRANSFAVGGIDVLNIVATLQP